MKADITGDMMMMSEGAIKAAATLIGVTPQEYRDHGRHEEVHCGQCKTWKHRSLISYRPKMAVLSGVCSECNLKKTPLADRAKYMREYRKRKKNQTQGA